MNHETEAPISLQEDVLARFAENLQTLCDGPSVDFHFSFDGALFAMKSRDRLVFDRKSIIEWRIADTATRIDIIFEWFEAAAKRYRELEGRRMKGRKGVA